MKFVKKIGDGDIKIKDNEVIEKTLDEKSEEWAHEFTQNFQVPLHETFLHYLPFSCFAEACCFLDCFLNSCICFLRIARHLFTKLSFILFNFPAHPSSS